MGVHGLWRLIENAGETVPLETLENKILAVDVSIWLHQAIKGFQDSRGAAVPNAHLLSLYHRICKLLYFRIRPVFVFDGGVPALKRETINKRHELKSKNAHEADRIHRSLLDTLLKHSAIKKVLSEKTKAVIASTSNPQKDEVEEMYVLPELNSTTSDPTTDSESEDESSPTKQWDLHSIDTKSRQFKSLPLEVRHEILTDLKETRKQSSWGRINELPTESNHFSSYQMNRLLKRQSVQTALEEIENEMGGHSLSLGELEMLLKDQGVLAKNTKIGSRIASDENTRFILIKDVKQALEDAKINEEKLKRIEEEPEELDETIDSAPQEQPSTSRGEIEETVKSTKSKADIEYEEDMKKALALSLEQDSSKESDKDTIEKSDQPLKNDNNLDLTFLQNYTDADFQSDSSEELEENDVQKFSSAQGYMMEYSGLSANAIQEIITNNVKTKKNTIKPNLDIPKASKEEKTKIVVEEKPPESPEKNASNNVEIMSNSESDNSGDFEDVEENRTDKNTLEIVFNKDESIEDDLFSDVFGKEENLDSTNVKIVEPPDKMDVVEIVEKIEEINREEIAPKSKTEIVKEIVKEFTKTDENKEQLSVNQMKEISDDLEKQTSNLVAEKSLKERLAGNITDQMYQEAQELLELFGVPYIVAPMEAEAQCAFLEEINLTQGTITDDSDIWLFGGRTVYKNFFNHSKQVQEYKSDNIQHHFKLTRELMILLALLVGSDYTLGLQGIGPVTALEILAAFPPQKTTSITVSHFQLITGLDRFRTWVHSGKLPGPGRTSLRTKLKNLKLTDTFPSAQVARAYLQPEVDVSEEKFTWSKPNIVALIEYALRKFGWSKNKTDEILNPVIKRMNDKHMQTSIKSYFKTLDKPEIDDCTMSKRVKTAVKRIGNEDVPCEDAPKPKQKRTRKKKKEVEKKIEEKPMELDEDLKMLEEVKKFSVEKLETLEKEVGDKLKELVKKTKRSPILPKKEVIPQKLGDKNEMLRKKMKAIEVFRKSKQGPGYVKKQKKTVKHPKEDAGLSESSDD